MRQCRVELRMAQASWPMAIGVRYWEPRATSGAVETLPGSPIIDCWKRSFCR